MSACARQVYPPDVIQYVKSQLKQVADSPDAANEDLPESMRLTNRMKEETGLRDALVSFDGIIFYVCMTTRLCGGGMVDHAAYPNVNFFPLPYS